MNLREAKGCTLRLLKNEIYKNNLTIQLDSWSPDPEDDAKFLLGGRRARIIGPYDGFYVNISEDWFDGQKSMPKIHGTEFYWYVFALRQWESLITHYYICDYLKIREFVLNFKPYGSNNHQNHIDWRGVIEIRSSYKNIGYFSWGDESPYDDSRKSRFITLNNIKEIPDRPKEAWNTGVFRILCQGLLCFAICRRW